MSFLSSLGESVAAGIRSAATTGGANATFISTNSRELHFEWNYSDGSTTAKNKLQQFLTSCSDTPSECENPLSLLARIEMNSTLPASNRDFLPFRLDSSLSNLVSLTLGENALDATLLEDVFSVTTLTDLDIQAHRMKVVPPACAQLKLLNRLCLSKNVLTSLPSEMMINFPELTHLDVSYNHLTDVPKDLLQICPKLQYLNFQYNKIRAATFDLRNSSLRTLLLAQNPLEFLASLLPLSSLTRVSLATIRVTQSGRREADASTEMGAVGEGEDMFNSIPVIVEIVGKGASSGGIASVPHPTKENLKYISTFFSTVFKSTAAFHPLIAAAVASLATLPAYRQIISGVAEAPVQLAAMADASEPLSLDACVAISRIAQEENFALRFIDDGCAVRLLTSLSSPAMTPLHKSFILQLFSRLVLLSDIFSLRLLAVQLSDPAAPSVGQEIPTDIATLLLQLAVDPSLPYFVRTRSLRLLGDLSFCEENGKIISQYHASLHLLQKEEKVSVAASRTLAILGITPPKETWRGVRVLSIDGGGVKGIIPLRILQELEKRTGKKSCELFDIIGGTSAGGMLAAGLAQGYSAEAMFTKYMNLVAAAFSEQKDLQPPPHPSQHATHPHHTPSHPPHHPHHHLHHKSTPPPPSPSPSPVSPSPYHISQNINPQPTSVESPAGEPAPGWLSGKMGDLGKIDLLSRTRAAATTLQRLVSVGSKYETQNLEKEIHKNIDPDMAGVPMIDLVSRNNAPKLLLLSALVSVRPLRPFLFRSYQVPADAKNIFLGSCRYELFQALRASSAAPYFFEDYVCASRERQFPGEVRFQDGGISTNNPILPTLHDAKILFPDRKFSAIVSLGTGDYPTQFRDPRQGSLRLLHSLSEHMVESATSTERPDEAVRILFDQNSYFRLNPVDDRCDVVIDETSNGAIEKLEQVALEFINQNSSLLDRIAAMLVEGSSDSTDIASPALDTAPSTSLQPTEPSSPIVIQPLILVECVSPHSPRPSPRALAVKSSLLRQRFSVGILPDISIVSASPTDTIPWWKHPALTESAGTAVVLMRAGEGGGGEEKGYISHWEVSTQIHTFETLKALLATHGEAQSDLLADFDLLSDTEITAHLSAQNTLEISPARFLLYISTNSYVDAAARSAASVHCFREYKPVFISMDQIRANLNGRPVAYATE